MATFDVYNTLLLGDVGEATFYWFLAHDLIHAPRTWSETCQSLTPKTVEALDRTCATAERFVPTSKKIECTAVILSIHDDNKLPDGTAAWKNYDKDKFKLTSAWDTQLLAGYGLDHIKPMISD